MLRRLLVAFDFDHTIINENSDTVVRDLMPSIPPDVRNLYRSDGWTAYMQKIFELLHSNGVTREQIQSAVKSIPVTPGFDKLLLRLHSSNCEIIIISDSNSEFITEWLISYSLDNTITKVFTNPASYNSDGCLQIEMYHLQDWCQLSTKNLCKGEILDGYIQERAKQGVEFTRVAYVGDGKNDFCPCLRLSSNDLVFPREGYALMDAIQATLGNDGQEQYLKAKVHPWNTGSDILQVITEYVLMWFFKVIPEGKRPAGRPRSSWKNEISKLCKKWNVDNWQELAQNRVQWRRFVRSVRDLRVT